MASPAEKIGRLLVQQGLLTDEQLASCLREQTANSTATLGEIIVSRGYLTAERLSSTLDGIGALTFRCPEGCGRFEVKRPRLDTPYPCRKCGAPLEAEEPQISWNSTSELPPPPGMPPEVVSASRDPKRILGKYVLVNELGRGGSATVFKAWDSILHQYVALKLIGTAGAGLQEDENSKEVQEFLREARTVVKLTHPNIVRVYEVGRQDGRYYLSMELIEGGSLAKLIHGRDANRRPKFYGDPQKYLAILRDAAKALDHAHHHHPPIVHRDVKPHNILVDVSGRACLADFGLAREMSGGGRLTVTGVTKGTPCYMAPEQARSGSARLDGRTDVYGLGAILYELLTGEPPFTGPSTHEILQKVVNEEPVPPSQAIRARGGAAHVPPALERIALKSLDKDPTRRYPSAALFAADVDRYLSGRSVEASGVSQAERGLRWASRRKAILIPAAVAVVMGIVALVAVLQGGRERVVERVVVQKEKVESPETRYGEIDTMAAGLRFGDALKKCEELRAEVKDPAVRARVAQMADDIRMEQQMLRGLVDRIRVQPRQYARFAMDGMAINRAEVVDASMDRIMIAGGGMRAGYPWAGVEPQQFVQLVRDYWPEIDGKPALGLALWARRHRVDATTKSPPAGSPETQYFRLLHEAERALSDGDLLQARDLFERALAINRDGKEAREGLDRVAAVSARKVAEKLPAAAPAPAPAPAAEPPVKPLENPGLAEEHHKKGSQFFDEGEYQEAVDELTLAIGYASKKGDALASRGYAYYMLGQWREARTDLVASTVAGSWNDDYPQLFIWMAACRLGQKEQATRTLRALAYQGAKSPKVDGPWFAAVAKHLTDDLSEAELLRLSKDETGVMKRIERECEAYFYIGTKQLFAGNTGAARQWFNRSVQTNVTKFIEYKGSQVELERLGNVPAPVVPAAPAPRPAPAARPGQPAPKLEANEKLILSVPEGVTWWILSISSDGTNAAYVAEKTGKKSLVWSGGRHDGLDEVDSVCLWRDGNIPVVKVGQNQWFHVVQGETKSQSFNVVSTPVLSPNRKQVTFVGSHTNSAVGTMVYLVDFDGKKDVVRVSPNTLSYTANNELFFAGAMKNSSGTTIDGYFLNGRPVDLPGAGAFTGSPAINLDGQLKAYPSRDGSTILVNGAAVRPFEKVWSPRFSWDGRVLAYVASGPMGKPAQKKTCVVVGNTAGAGYDDVAGAPVLSRDGKTVAYIAKRGDNWLVVHGTRTSTEEFDTILSRIYDVDQPVMSGDGKTVAYTAVRRGNLPVLIVNGIEVDSQPNLSAPSLSGDGKFVSYGFVSGPYFIWKTVPVPVR